MFQDVIADRSLLHLEDMLFDLDHYSFDRDIIKLLNELKILVDKKIYKDNFNPCGYDIKDTQYIIHYIFDENTIGIKKDN